MNAVNPNFRALTQFSSLPFGYCTLPIRDDASAPHLNVGEFAVIDTADCELQKGELYVIDYGGDSERRVVQIRLGHVYTLPSGRYPNGRRKGVWWVDELAGFRRTKKRSMEFLSLPG